MKKLTGLVIIALVFFSATLAPGGGDKPSKSVLEFLKYYKTNYERLAKINMVLNYNGNAATNGSTTYAVDFKGAEKYLTEVKKSGFVHAKLVEKIRSHLLNVDKDLKTNPQKEGTPRGFETDFVMLSSSFMDDLNNLDKIEIKDEAIRSNASATVKIKFATGTVRVYELAKQNNVWLISDITM